MKEIVIHGRKAYKGHVAGEALVSTDGLGTFGSINEKTGVVTEREHSIFGESITGKVLVFPYAKGSSAWGRSFQVMDYNGVTPKAMLVSLIDTRSALGAVAARLPTVTDFDIDPLTVIETGDWVDVNADEGIITITKKDT